MSRRTPLHAVHERLGAQLTDFAGWTMPLRYRGDLAEHHAVRQRGGLFDLSHMGEVELSGAGAGDALDHALVSRVSALEVGRARYTMLCADDGGVVDDLIVYRRATDRWLVVANAANAAVVAGELAARAAGFDTRVDDLGEAIALVALQGPLAVDVLTSLGVGDLDGLRYYAAREVAVAGVEAYLARTGYTGEDGFELFVAAADAAAVWEALAAAGEPYGVEPAGLACRDTLRLEAAMPLYGHELSRDRTPFEAGLGRIVHLDTPRDFVGRAALEQRATTGPTERLVGLAAEGRRAPRAGYAVLDRDRQVGEVTSGAPSPTLGVPIALAYVATTHAEVGTPLTVDVRGTPTPAQVVERPFYRRER